MKENKITVLLADDHQLMVEGFMAILAKESDIEVVGRAANGHQALSLVRELKPDIILLDINMPGMGGVEVANALVVSHPETLIIVVTGLDDTNLFRKLRLAGVKGYLLKDQSSNDLVQAIRDVQRGETFWGKAITNRVMDELIPTAPNTSPRLTEKEVEVLRLICSCGTAGEIAHLMGLKESTVQTHIKHMLSKLNLRNKTALALYAQEKGYGG